MTIIGKARINFYGINSAKKILISYVNADNMYKQHETRMEGVYLASGGGVNADYTVTRVQNEPSEYYPTARYQIKFNSLPSSSGQFQQEADAVLQVQGANVTAVAAEANCTVSNSGNTINVHLISWNNIAQIAVTCDSHIFTVN